MNGKDDVLEFTRSRMLVAFRSGEIPSGFHFAHQRERMLKKIRDKGCDTIGFDLTGTTTIPSGFVGAIMALQQVGVSIELYNAGEQIRELLFLTRLDRVASMHEACPVLFAAGPVA